MKVGPAVGPDRWSPSHSRVRTEEGLLTKRIKVKLRPSARTVMRAYTSISIGNWNVEV